ncbi:hypothetical protein ACFQYP_15750 [Nonomuraea antimicrobica]
MDLLRRDWTIRTRMTVLSTLVVTLICAVLIVLGLAFLHASDMKHRVNNAYHGTWRVAFRYDHQPIPAVIDDVEGLWSVQVVDPSGQVIAASRPLLGNPRLALFTPRGARAVWTWSAAGYRRSPDAA